MNLKKLFQKAFVWGFPLLASLIISTASFAGQAQNASPPPTEAVSPSNCSGKWQIKKTDDPDRLQLFVLVDCKSPYGYRIYLTNSAEVKRTLEISDGPAHHISEFDITRHELEFTEVNIAPTKG